MPCFDVALGTVTVMSSSLGIWAALNTTYRCNSPASFNVGGVTVTFSDMRLEAYMPGNDLSPTGTASIRRLAFLAAIKTLTKFTKMFHHRERLHGGPGHHHSATSHHHQYCSNHNRSSANPCRYAWTWHLLRIKQQWHRVHPGQYGSAAQRVLLLSFSK